MELNRMCKRPPKTKQFICHDFKCCVIVQNYLVPKFESLKKKLGIIANKLHKPVYDIFLQILIA